GCLVAAVAARLILFVGGFRGVSTMMINLYLVTGLLLSVLWAGASWMVTPRRVAEHWPWMRLPRLFVRFSQVLWPVGYVCWLLAAVTSADVMDTLGRLSRCMAGAGTIVLAFMLCRVAEEAERENAARRLNAAVWLLPVATLVPQLFPSSIAWFTLVPLGMFLLLWAWVMLLLASGLLELQRHVTWAKVHAEEGHTRRQRIIETHQQIEREVEASIRPLQPPLPEVPLDPQGDPAGR
ncbi:MAG: hypothetical protein IH888_13385, partial [Planctomycetes bacterium]|nr:hypothetical protein [Planctomycetota bacterium]